MKIEKNIVNVLFIVVISIIPLFFVSSISYAIYLHYSKVPKNNVLKTIGIVTGRTKNHRGPKSSIVEFSYKNIRISTKSSDGYVIGEKFIVEFEKDNPNINEVKEDYPIFLPEEEDEVDITVGYLESINLKFENLIYFFYFVDGKKYEQFYKPIDNIYEIYPNLKEGKKYRVKYWKLNPERSIMLFDKPPLPLEQFH
jgi:hypothetical protein